MSDRNRPAVLRRRSLCALPGLSVLVTLCAILGCASTPPYYLIESRYTESGRSGPPPDVTQTPDFPAVHHLIQLVALKPPDVCADRGQSGRLGTASLELGVLRTRCGVEMAELERALARAGYRVVSWDALHHLAASREIPILQAASELRADALFQVNTLERIDIRPGADARWERRFHHAEEDGTRSAPALVPASRRNEFESLVARHERGRIPARRIGATINVSVVSVATGTAIWFYEWTRIEDVGAEPRLEILVDCDDEGCREVAASEASTGEALSDRSTSSIAREGDVPDDSQAVFQMLVRDLVTDLAERFAGRR
jgi:hypothetical protein